MRLVRVNQVEVMSHRLLSVRLAVFFRGELADIPRHEGRNPRAKFLVPGL